MTPKEAINHLEAPKGRWGKILATTPIVLTVLATAFAGLSSSEMTQAMYHRSLAAQHQSRAGDQWAFFQAKRIRGSTIESSIEVLQATGHPDPFDAAQPESALARMQQLLEEHKSDPGGADRSRSAAGAVKAARDR